MELTDEELYAVGTVLGGLVLLCLLCCCCCRRWSLWDVVACVCLYELCCDDRRMEDDGMGFVLC